MKIKDGMTQIDAQDMAVAAVADRAIHHERVAVQAIDTTLATHGVVTDELREALVADIVSLVESMSADWANDVVAAVAAMWSSGKSTRSPSPRPSVPTSVGSPLPRDTDLMWRDLSIDALSDSSASSNVVGMNDFDDSGVDCSTSILVHPLTVPAQGSEQSNVTNVTPGRSNATASTVSSGMTLRGQERFARARAAIQERYEPEMKRQLHAHDTQAKCAHNGSGSRKKTGGLSHERDPLSVGNLPPTDCKARNHMAAPRVAVSAKTTKDRSRNQVCHEAESNKALSATTAKASQRPWDKTPRQAVRMTRAALVRTQANAKNRPCNACRHLTGLCLACQSVTAKQHRAKNRASSKQPH